MPCNSDYLEPTGKEKQLRRVAQMYDWLLKQLEEDVPSKVHATATNQYASDDYTADLCARLTELEEQEFVNRFQTIMYAPNKMARELATWWEEHQEADRKRLEEEARLEADHDRFERLMAQFSEEDRNFIDGYYQSWN